MSPLTTGFVSRYLPSPLRGEDTMIFQTCSKPSHQASCQILAGASGDRKRFAAIEPRREEGNGP